MRKKENAVRVRSIRRKSLRSQRINSEQAQESASDTLYRLAVRKETSRGLLHQTGLANRLAVVQRLQQVSGNIAVQQYLSKQPTQVEGIQLKGEKKSGAANPGGGGPGKMQHAIEQPYEVTGASLADLTEQLHQIDGYGSETYTAITIQGRVMPTKTPDEKYQVKVKWIITDASTKLPRWADYDNACPAAQQEWDRFMKQTRLHEQQAHVDAAQAFVDGLGDADTVITGDSIDDLKNNLEAKQIDLGERLQKIHDGCDHGVGIDALLHAERGVCE